MDNKMFCPLRNDLCTVMETERNERYNIDFLTHSERLSMTSSPVSETSSFTSGGTPNESLIEEAFSVPSPLTRAQSFEEHEVFSEEGFNTPFHDNVESNEETRVDGWNYFSRGSTSTPISPLEIRSSKKNVSIQLLARDLMNIELGQKKEVTNPDKSDKEIGDLSNVPSTAPAPVAWHNNSKKLTYPTKFMLPAATVGESFQQDPETKPHTPSLNISQDHPHDAYDKECPNHKSRPYFTSPTQASTARKAVLEASSVSVVQVLEENQTRVPSSKLNIIHETGGCTAKNTRSDSNSRIFQTGPRQQDHPPNRMTPFSSYRKSSVAPLAGGMYPPPPLQVPFHTNPPPLMNAHVFPFQHEGLSSPFQHLPYGLPSVDAVRNGMHPSLFFPLDLSASTPNAGAGSAGLTCFACRGVGHKATQCPHNPRPVVATPDIDVVVTCAIHGKSRTSKNMFFNNRFGVW
eukprot:CAMPEP_0201483664 /NCGR_PEP_ID=MMETSP0151_2-20130828/7859_1 /ASSEMBLY_ACC=CAM_ASM_000257 /TAXON_ID=200890 /ORGANISM="Paramoeba atlantica, Strain 621/1 / CCAP 1560/9" /LENGTH=459 /DNA_ID=CAMNT_0047866923 /DNA_START=88 /DNA_END=1464 /DNA_ORIENTATION=+